MSRTSTDKALIQFTRAGESFYVSLRTSPTTTLASSYDVGVFSPTVYIHRWQSGSYTKRVGMLTTVGSSFSAIANSFGITVKSFGTDSVTVTVVLAPTITTQPTSASVTVLNTFSFTAAGTAPFGTVMYQWRRNGVNIAGATSATYTAVAQGADNGAAYTCYVYTIGGAVVSSAATLSVFVPAPVINTQPANANGVVGQESTFSVSASGYQLSYQWRRNNVAIAGATASTLQFTPAEADLAVVNTFTCVVSNQGGSVTSATATLIMATIITTQPAAYTAAPVGQATVLSVTAVGSFLSYQWLRGGVAIDGEVSASLSYTPVIGDVGSPISFRCDITNILSTVSSNVAVVDAFVALPVISEHPVSQWAAIDAVVTFSVTASGYEIAFQW